jgi:Tol biopolymer transport system component
MTFAAGLSFGAVWSPSGQRIAYFFVDAATTDTDIWYFDITVGPEPVPVTTGDVAANVKRLSWSADSEFLVYDAPQPDGAESDIFRVAIASGEITNLTEDSADWDASPTWSPDGQWIAFVSDRAEVGQGSDNIWLLDTAEGQVQQLTNSDATLQEDIEPAWSPDGSQIAFLRHSLLGELGDPTSPSGLWLVDVSTGEEQLLLEITGQLVGVQPPVWSPNGRWLAYNAPGTADTDIWVVSVEGGEPINVSNLPGEDASISWAPSSRELIFTNSAAGILSQYIVDADGSALGLLVESGQNGLGSWSP